VYISCREYKCNIMHASILFKLAFDITIIVFGCTAHRAVLTCCHRISPALRSCRQLLCSRY
jgi:hypothetical protein